MTNWPVMSDILTPSKGDRFEIAVYELTEKQLQLYQVRDLMNRRREHAYQKPGMIMQLRDTASVEVIMADTEMERRTNQDFVWNANGDVLIGGLGLGIVLLAIQEQVQSITVIELHKEIIDLVVPQLPLKDNVTIICDDILTWYPPKDVLYDTIYFDIWNGVCGDNYEDMKRLHRRFARRLNRTNPDHWMNSWRRADVKRLI